jgi:hypothetical protein
MTRPTALGALLRLGLLAGLCAGLAGCRTFPTAPPPPHRVTIEAAEAWRGEASASDAAMLDSLPSLWADSLGEARRAGFERRIAAEGALLDPAAGLARAAPPPGAYLCRMIRLGARGPAARPWLATGRGFCFVGVQGDQLSLTLDAGAQRIGGYLWEDKASTQLVFLAALTGRGSPLGGYGDDPRRNAIGRFDRIGNFRYRLTMPWHGEGKLAIFELVPAPVQ